MKRYLLSALILLCLSFNSHSQDVGYRTVDAGLGFQYVKNGSVMDLLVSINAEEYHSIVLKASYITTNGVRTATHKNEEGKGWGGSIGYRYHFSVIPKRFFLGLNAGLISMNIHWNGTITQAETRVLVLQPAAEAGYTLVINDQFFITPYITASLQKVISTKGEKVAYGDAGFVPMAGLTMGWRF